MIVDVQTIPTEELQNDLKETRDDIANCAYALKVGVTTYSGVKSVAERLRVNQGIEGVILAELKRRGADGD